MKSYFKFSKSQKIGVIAFAIIIVLQIIFLNKGSGISIPDPFVVTTDQFKIIDSSASASNRFRKDKYKNEYTLSKFDPNEYNVEDWKKIGFSEKQSSIIVNYKNKTNGFKRNSDLEKVFVINEKKFNELEPFLDIQEFKYTDNYQTKKELKIDKPLIIYELNSASVNELVNINGIGEFTAKGIIKHKNLIGGFHSVIQLNEVYGIAEGNYEKIIKQLTVNSSSIKKINVNELSIFELKKHYYISWSTAESIINKRLMGKLSSLNFLVTDGIISVEKLDILLPYIEY